MNEDLERRLRRSLSERSADPLRGESSLPRPTRRRARARRATNALSAVLAASIVIAGTTTLISQRSAGPPAASLPPASPTRVPEPSATAAPTVEPAPRSTPVRSALARVAEVPDAGAKIAAHGGVWVIATTRVLKYTTSGRLDGRIVLSDIAGANAVLEPRVVAADDGGVWIAGAGADDVDRTLATDRCDAIEPAGGDRDGEAFVMRIDAGTMCPSVLIKLGVASEPDASEPGLLPTPSSSPATARSRFVRWHGLAFAAGSLWIGADGGMLRADLAAGTLEEVGVDAYSVGAGFGSIWAAVSQNRGTPGEDNFIARIDPETARVIATIDVPPADPSTTTDFAEVHVGPDAVWAEGWGIVAQIDPDQNRVVAGYDVGGEHLMGDMASGDGRFYLADNGPKADGVWVIDATRRVLLRKIATGAPANGIALAGDRLWFSRSGEIWRLKLE